MNELLNKAVLCKISISQFNPKRNDVKTTQEVLANRSASRTAGVWVKNLINPKTLENITAVSQQARLENYRLSLPWADEGWRILPMKTFMEYQEKIRECKAKFEMEVDKFLNRYEEYVEDARRALGDTFNLSEYPSKLLVKEKFNFRVSMVPLPCGNDFRINMAEDELKEMRANVDNLVQEAEGIATKDLWNRLATPIKHMVDKLSKDDSIFRDSLVSNVEEIVKLIPALNITENKELETLTEECKKLTQNSPDMLRINKDVRKDVVTQAEDLLQKMKGYL